MADKGWVKIHRKMLDNPIVCKDSDHLSVWVYLLLNATHDSYPMLFNGKKVTLEPGQLITGRKSISKQLTISESKVKRILLCFESDQQIDRQRGNQSSLITITKWGDYQDYDETKKQDKNKKNTQKNKKNDQQLTSQNACGSMLDIYSEFQNDQQMTSKRPADDQQATTNKNVKNKRTKEVKIYIDPKLEIPLKDFADMRKRIKAPLTDRAIEMLMNKLEDLSGGDIDKQIKILNQSTLNSWKSVYEIKDTKQQSPKRDILMEIISEGRNEQNGNSANNEIDTIAVQKLLP